MKINHDHGLDRSPGILILIKTVSKTCASPQGHAALYQWWVVMSAITCQIIMSTCQIFMLTCHLFMSTCQLFMSTCQKNIITTSS